MSQEKMNAEKKKTAKTEKVKKDKGSKKPNIFVRMGKKMKEVFSELKKVNWPTFAKVVKNTGVVLAVVAVFLVVVTLFDFGLSQLLLLLIGG